jgi:hypothetical protein
MRIFIFDVQVWAVMEPVPNIAQRFEELVPDLALSFPFKLDAFQKEVYCFDIYSPFSAQTWMLKSRLETNAQSSSFTLLKLLAKNLWTVLVAIRTDVEQVHIKSCAPSTSV